MEWEILLTDGVEAFLDALYEADRDSHSLVNQPSWCWSATVPRRGVRWWTR